MFKNLMLLLGLTLCAFQNDSFAAKSLPCLKVQVLDDSCKPGSFQVDIESCNDALLNVQVERCNKDSAILSVRGKVRDYRVTLKPGTEAWQTTWQIENEQRIPHRRSEKTMQKTANERTPPPAATLLVPATEADRSAQPSEQKISSAITFQGHLDIYAGVNFNSPGTGPSGMQNNLRYYDLYANQISLQLAELTIKHVRKETSFLLDLDFGTFADMNAQPIQLTPSGGPVFGTPNELTKHIGQAILTYTPAKAPRWLFEIGKLPTHVGLELMKSKDNWNYSRSTLFSFGGPFWHTGVHVGYSLIPNQLSLGTYLYNGWGTVNDTNFVPTYGLQLKWVPNERFTWIYNAITGPEQPSNNQQWKTLHETNLSYTINPTLSIASDFLYGFEQQVSGPDAIWYGAQVGLKWQTSPTFYLSPRVEFFRDPVGYALGGGNQTLSTYTLTNSYLVSEGFEVRLEFRMDQSTSPTRFITRTGTASSQPTAVLGMLYTM